ncbi:YqeY-like protein [Oxalobacter formigenes OXCC13]|uniref:YqeY-like protein n=1 Tax=Oxalobacter formigenes OXCC13 TaxID=556269 RepID=C3XAR5_OXAFO|nr:YqeY-like protein [Oxalobacter formigenes OXCC13]
MFQITKILEFDVSLKEQIVSDMKDAMRAKDAKRLGTIRMLTAAMKQKEVDERIELNDQQVQSIIEKMIKQRKDSITQFEAGGRPDLADNEKAEVEVLSAYMPAALSMEEIEKEVADAVAGAGASGPQDMGKVMGVLKGRLAGRADMSAVSALVKKALTKA